MLLCGTLYQYYIAADDPTSEYLCFVVEDLWKMRDLAVFQVSIIAPYRLLC